MLNNFLIIDNNGITKLRKLLDQVSYDMIISYQMGKDKSLFPEGEIKIIYDLFWKRKADSIHLLEKKFGKEIIDDLIQLNLFSRDSAAIRSKYRIVVINNYYFLTVIRAREWENMSIFPAIHAD